MKDDGRNVVAAIFCCTFVGLIAAVFILKGMISINGIPGPHAGGILFLLGFSLMCPLLLSRQPQANRCIAAAIGGTCVMLGQFLIFQ